MTVMLQVPLSFLTSASLTLSGATTTPLIPNIDPPSGDTTDFTTTIVDNSTLGIAMSDVITIPPAPVPEPGEVWLGWGVTATATPADSCADFFATLSLPSIELPCYPQDQPPPQDPIDTLPAGELAYRALALAKIEGAGLQVQPHIRAYVGVPTLVHATHPQRDTSVELLGHPIHVSFTASSYSYTFNDGTAPLVTTDPSGPFPISRLRHIYHEPFPTQTITLETIWSAHITHPTTGQTITLDSALTTRETSPPFEVRKARGYLTDTAEELKGR